METRWIRRAGPGVAVIGALAVIASTTAGAPAPTWDPPDCPGPAAIGTTPIGAWFRLDPVIVDGAFSGQRLTMGRADLSVVWHLELDAESFASGPLGGTVVVGTDAGRASELSLIDLADGCRWPLASARDVIRNAIVSRDGRSMVESRVDRRSRTDLGVWRRPLAGGPETRLLPPLAADVRFGPTWRTDLDWAADDDTLVVGSCGEAACRYRLLPGSGDVVTTIADPTLGASVGLAEGHLVTHAACRGMPCPLVSVDVADRTRTTIHDAAGLAVLTRDEQGRSVIVHEIGVDGGSLRSVAPDGVDGRLLPSAPRGLRLVGDIAWAGGAAEHPGDQLIFGPDGRLPVDGIRSALLRAPSEDEAVPLGKVRR
jgi:hypothetical protein